MAHEDVNFGERLRDLREAAGMSPSQLAARVGISENAIRQMEYGYTKNASFPVGIRLADALNVTPHYLATGTEVRIIAPEGLEVSVEGSGFSIGLQPGAMLYGGSVADFRAMVERATAEAVAALRRPAASAAEKESPGPSVAAPEDRIAKVESDVAEATAALRDIQRSLGLRPGSRKRGPRGA